MIYMGKSSNYYWAYWAMFDFQRVLQKCWLITKIGDIVGIEWEIMGYSTGWWYIEAACCFWFPTFYTFSRLAIPGMRMLSLIHLMFWDEWKPLTRYDDRSTWFNHIFSQPWYTSIQSFPIWVPIWIPINIMKHPSIYNHFYQCILDPKWVQADYGLESIQFWIARELEPTVKHQTSLNILKPYEAIDSSITFHPLPIQGGSLLISDPAAPSSFMSEESEGPSEEPQNPKPFGNLLENSWLIHESAGSWLWRPTSVNHRGVLQWVYNGHGIQRTSQQRQRFDPVR